MDTPNGPLELEVYPGPECRGELYFDEGVSLSGPSLSQSIQCVETPRGIALRFGPRQGSWKPWWKQIQVTVHGPKTTRMTIADQPAAAEVAITAAAH
jgi:alpha-glucosidase